MLFINIFPLFLSINSILCTNENIFRGLNKMITTSIKLRLDNPEDHCGQVKLTPKSKARRGDKTTKVILFESQPISSADADRIFGKFKSASIDVVDGCRIKVCGFSRNSRNVRDNPWTTGNCQTFSETLSTLPIIPFGMSFTATSISCACKKNRTKCDTDTCANKPVKLNPGDCAVLYQEKDCQDCYFNGVPLNVHGNYMTKKSSAIGSLFVRPGCRIVLEAFGRLDYQSQGDSFRSYFTTNMTRLQPSFSKKGETFSCNCSEEVAVSRPLEFTRKESIAINSTTTSVASTSEIRTPTASPEMTSSYEVEEVSTFDNQNITIQEQKDIFEETLIQVVPYLVAIFVVAGIIIMISSFCYFRSQNAILTKREVRQFRWGASLKLGTEEIEMKKLARRYSSAWNYPYDNSFEKRRQDVKFARNDPDAILGKGVYGIVYKGTLRVCRTEVKAVAIKTLVNPDKMELKSLLNEIKIHSYLDKNCSCPNIVRFFGACTANLRKGDVLNIIEYCPSGNLQSYLEKRRKELEVPLPEKSVLNGYMKDVGINQRPKEIKVDLMLFNQLVKWSGEIATGMEYLNRKSVLHIDLAARNILLSEDLTAKISDFGLSRKLYHRLDYAKKGKEFLPVKWMALESLTQDNYSVNSDLWAYGVTVWEIFSLGKEPYHSHSPFLVQQFLQSGGRLEKPINATDDIYQIMRSCWNSIPEERPTFNSVLDFFQRTQRNYQSEIMDC